MGSGYANVTERRSASRVAATSFAEAAAGRKRRKWKFRSVERQVGQSVGHAELASKRQHGVELADELSDDAKDEHDRRHSHFGRRGDFGRQPGAGSRVCQGPTVCGHGHPLEASGLRRCRHSVGFEHDKVAADFLIFCSSKCLD